MRRNLLTSKAFWAFLLTFAVAGAAYAGSGCAKSADVATAEKGHHCHLLAKNITKKGEMTENGANVTLTGTTPKAIEHIKEHLEVHAKGSDCPGCPLAMEGVTTSVKMTDDGGVIMATGDSPKTIQALQEWAKRPAGHCCGGKKADKA